MPRFPVAFNRRKSNADTLENAVTGSSFRVLDRSEVVSGHNHSFSTSSGNTLNGNGSGNSASRFSVKSQSMPSTLALDNDDDSNLFANLNTNRGSANTTNTNSTDNSSRHSNVSTAPSSADLNVQQHQQQQYHQQQYHQYQQQQDDDWRAQSKKAYGDVPVPPIPKSSTTSSFLKSAGRTLSFGGNKKHLPVLPNDSKPPQTPPNDMTGGRDRSMTASTVTTATPPKIDEDHPLDLGGDFSKMLGNFDNKRASAATLRMGQQINGDRNQDKNGDKNGGKNGATDRPALAPRSLTGNRLNQPAPIQVDQTANIEPSPYSWSSQHSNDKLLHSQNMDATANENAPPPVPRHAPPPPQVEQATSHTSNDPGLNRSSANYSHSRSTTVEDVAEAEDEDTVFLRNSIYSVNRFLEGTGPSSSRFGRRQDSTLDSSYSKVPTESTSPQFGAKAVEDDEDNLFDNSTVHSNRLSRSYASRKPSQPRNKVMTPAQFERYRKDKEREDARKSLNAGDVYDTKTTGNNSDSDDDDNYEDDVDEAEKSREAAKQRRKQEAHMAVYRQQMMKVTGDSGAAVPPQRASIFLSMSTPNLPSLSGTSPHDGSEGGGNEDDDEEVPLAILAAHGFPNRNRPPTRLSTMMSNPNLRAAAAPSFQRPQTAVNGDAQQSQQPAAGHGGRLPVFARNLPQDPYGLVNTNQRETLNFSGGAPASAGGLPPGGLVGVIASEERSRAMRRGSPALDANQKPLPNMNGTNPHFDPMGAIPAQMMYPGVGAGMGGQMPMMSPADQVQIQMSQQMQQFMQMQMQFMQMMANNGNGQRPMSQYGSVQGAPMGMGMGGMGADGSVRNSFADNAPMLDLQLPRPDTHSRTMSMVQPSSASWIQPPQHNMGSGYAPSIRVQGTNVGYTPSIAPSERSNVGMPGRYRPVSHMPTAVGGTSPSLDPSPGSTSGATSPGWDLSRKHKSPSPLQKESITTVTAVEEEDDEEGWAAMKAKRDKKRSMWKSKKSLSSELGALIS